MIVWAKRDWIMSRLNSVGVWMTSRLFTISTGVQSSNQVFSAVAVRFCPRTARTLFHMSLREFILSLLITCALRALLSAIIKVYHFFPDV